MKLRITKLYQSPVALKGLELLLDITFLIDPAQHALLKRLKDHIDINYVVPTEMVKSKRVKKKPNSVLMNLAVQTLDMMLLKFLSNALQHFILQIICFISLLQQII